MLIVGSAAGLTAIAVFFAWGLFQQWRARRRWRQAEKRAAQRERQEERQEHAEHLPAE
jgi:uncharacterized membrane protein